MLDRTMRRHALLILLLSLAAAAQPPAAPPIQAPASTTSAQPPDTATPQAAPRTTIPSDSNERSRPKNYQDCRDRVAAAQGHPVDILFVGDSITEAWTGPAWGGYLHGAAVWDKFYASRNALNFGVGADRTEHVLYRLNTMDVQAFKPRVTVLLIGTNNTRDTPADIAAGVHGILDKLRTLYPTTKIILVSILPNARATQLMADTNVILRTFADDRTVFYFDLAAHMPPAGDTWQGLGPDKLHPDQTGYQIWADAMEPLLTRLLLSAVPAPAPIP
jgi:lysophospholipase L1-like esterase